MENIIYVPVTDKPIPTEVVIGFDDKGFIAGVYTHNTTAKICGQAGQEYPNKIICWLEKQTLQSPNTVDAEESEELKVAKLENRLALFEDEYGVSLLTISDRKLIAKSLIKEHFMAGYIKTPEKKEPEIDWKLLKESMHQFMIDFYRHHPDNCGAEAQDIVNHLKGNTNWLRNKQSN